MSGRTLAVVVGLSLAVLGVVAHLGAQSPATSVRQVAYLKASNPQVGAHFGCGGALDGHAGIGVAMSADGNTIAVAVGLAGRWAFTGVRRLDVGLLRPSVVLPREDIHGTRLRH